MQHPARTRVSYPRPRRDRLRHGLLLAIALAACGGPAGPDAPPPESEPPDPPAIAAGSLALTLAVAPRCEGIDPCTRTPEDAPLWLAMLAGGKLLRVSSPAEVVEIPVLEGRARIGAPLLLEKADHGEAALDTLEIELLDGDADGELDGALASGTGRFGFLDGACDDAASHGVFDAVSESTSAFESPGVVIEEAIWPASGIPVRSAGSALRITSASATVDGEAYALEAPAERGVLVALGPAPLPFGTAGVLALDVEDITGSAHGHTATFQTVLLTPGSLDGTFEGGTLGGMASTGVRAVDRYLVPGENARIAYARSGTITFPVDVPEGGGTLSCRIWALNQPGVVELRVVGPGGFSLDRLALHVTVDVPDVPAIFAPGMLQAVSEPLTLTKDLGAHAGQVAVVEIRLEGPPACEVQDEFAGFALDGLSLP